MSTNKAWFLAKRPTDKINSETLELRDIPVPEPKDGEVLVKVKYISIDPTHRIWMSDKTQYMEPVALGALMRAVVVGEVVQSNVSTLPVGTFVSGIGGLAEYLALPASGLQPLDTSIPLTTYLSVLGAVIGLTAYVGAYEICKIKQGDVVVVSGAAGAVGSIFGQLAKDLGAKKVIGIVGSEDKAKWLTQECGFDATINYKTDDVLAKLKEVAAEGVDAYFDNVGGKITEAVFKCCNNYAHIAICGLISGYNDDSGDVPLANFQMILHRRLNVRGFICLDHFSLMPDCMSKLSGMLKAGKLHYKEDVQKGLERYIDVVNMLFDGTNQGKLILEVQ